MKIKGQAWWYKPIIQDTWKVQIRRITVQDQSRQKVSECSHLNKTNWEWWYRSVILAAGSAWLSKWTWPLPRWSFLYPEK
jgi:hypothetical protein